MWPGKERSGKSHSGCSWTLWTHVTVVLGNMRATWSGFKTPWLNFVPKATDFRSMENWQSSFPSSTTALTDWISSSFNRSSASRYSTQSAVVCSKAKLRWAAKSSVQARKQTLAPWALASSTVLSVLPESMTRTSGVHFLAFSTTSTIFSSSFFVKINMAKELIDSAPSLVIFISGTHL